MSLDSLFKISEWIKVEQCKSFQFVKIIQGETNLMCSSLSDR